MKRAKEIASTPIRKEPWPSWPILGDEEKKAVARVIDSNQLFAATEVKAFEESFSEYIGSKYALGVGNATEGLHIALAALDIGVNDEVIVSPYTWISSASCALMQNAVPIFADCEADTLALSASAVEENISPRTRAVILVHMFGYPANVNSIIEVTKKHGLALIEDASHAHGALYHGSRIGTFGDISVFSLHQRKNLCTGDGGMVLTDDAELASRIYKLRSFGYHELSYNYRMTEFAAALGRTRLKRLDEENEVRRQNALYLEKQLRGLSGITVRKPIQGAVAVYYRVLLEYDSSKSGIPLGTIIDYLNAEGIPFTRTYEPLHRHPHFNPISTPARGCPWQWELYDGSELKNINYRDLSFPVVEEYCDNRLIELPVHPPVGQEDILQAAEAIHKVASIIESS